MTLQLTIIGLNRAGLSFGLALEEEKDKLFRCGFDPAAAKVKSAETLGAFDKMFYHLKEAVRDADVVLLSLPVDQIEETIKEMADSLKEGAVLINTAPANTAFNEWSKKYLPAGRRSISMIPAGNGLYLLESEEEGRLPHADLFRNADLLLAVDVDTHPDAVSMATDLAAIIGAKPCFVDPLEADGMLAKIDLLPKLAAYALLDSTIQQSGWQDTKRFASATYAKGVSLLQHSEESAHPSEQFLANRANALFAIDGMLSSLVNLRALIEKNDGKSLDALLTELQDDLNEWLDLRAEGDFEKKNAEPTRKPATVMGRLFGLGPKGDVK